MNVLSKRLLIVLAAFPFLLHASNASAEKVGKRCTGDCPFFTMEEMESFLNRPFAHMNMLYSASSMKENDKAYLISVDLPGMDKKDISIERFGNRLTISGERKEESEVKEKASYESKRSLNSFQQSFILPDDANFDAISATSINGVLKITVPKSGTKKVSKKIEIK